MTAAAVDRDIVSCIPVQTVCPHFDVVFGGSVFGLVSFAFQKITLGIGSFVFHYWMEKRRCSDGFVVSFFGLPRNVLRRLTRDIVPILLGTSPFHQCCRVQECWKNAFVQFVLQENRHSIQAESLTIYVSHTGYPVFHTA